MKENMRNSSPKPGDMYSLLRGGLSLTVYEDIENFKPDYKDGVQLQAGTRFIFIKKTNIGYDAFVFYCIDINKLGIFIEDNLHFLKKVV